MMSRDLDQDMGIYFHFHVEAQSALGRYQVMPLHTCCCLQVHASGFGKDLLVERIVLLGLSGRKEGWMATDSQGQPLEVSWGPLHLKEGLPDSAMHIRKPDLPVSEEWHIQLRR